MEAEGEANNQDDEEYGDLEEGEDDILEDDDVDPDPVEESHLEEQIDPGQSDGDGSDFPMEARRFEDEAVATNKEREAVDEEVKEEYKWQLWSSQLLHLFKALFGLSPDRIDFTINEEEHDPSKIEHEQNDAKDWIPLFVPRFF